MTRPVPPVVTSRRTEAPPDGENGPYVLTVHVTGRAAWTVTLVPGENYAIGRHKAADIVLDNGCVSERHAIITADEPPYMVDLGSRNGTAVDGQQLIPQTARSLAVGSVIAIAGVSLVVARGEVQTSAVMRRVVPFVRAPQLPTQERGRNALAAPAGIHDPAMLGLYAFARRIAPSSVSVLITGETGVGKELMAQAIHSHSARASRELVVLNCAALPENLVESELFGYERGAFSGAAVAKPGLFEAAHRSTFFLDEIGELSASAQAKLLRVLETGEVQRLGAVRPTRVEVRIVAATNRHLPSEVARGGFRADLFYRLNGLTISIPPLRARPDDIEPLARYFAAHLEEVNEVRFSPEAMAELRAYCWPGNVRELKSVVGRAALMRRAELIDAADLLLEGPTAQPVNYPEDRGPESVASREHSTERFARDEFPTGQVRAELERREHKRIKDALELTAGNQTEAARLLGISRRTLMNRMDRFGISRPRKSPGRNDAD